MAISGLVCNFRNGHMLCFSKKNLGRLRQGAIFSSWDSTVVWDVHSLLGILDPLGTTFQFFELFPGSDSMVYGHLWFIYNLLIYSVLLTPLFSYVRNNPEGKIVQATRSLLKIRYGMGLLIVPPVILALNGILFKPWEFGEVGMWWEFPRYMIYFLFGYLMIAAKEDYFPAIDKIRIPVTILTPLLAFVWFVSDEMFETPEIYAGGWVLEGYDAFAVEPTIAAVLQSFHAWFWCLLSLVGLRNFSTDPANGLLISMKRSTLHTSSICT